VPKYRASDESGIFPGGPRPLQDESISDGTAAETVKILQAAILTDSKLHSYAASAKVHEKPHKHRKPGRVINLI
jgi:hypothetical protein